MNIVGFSIARDHVPLYISLLLVFGATGERARRRRYYDRNRKEQKDEDDGGKGRGGRGNGGKENELQGENNDEA